MSNVSKIIFLYILSIVLFTTISKSQVVAWDCFYHIYESVIVIIGVIYMSKHIKTSNELPLFAGVVIYKSLIIVFQLISFCKFAIPNNYELYRNYMVDNSIILFLSAGVLLCIVIVEWILKHLK